MATYLLVLSLCVAMMIGAHCSLLDFGKMIILLTGRLPVPYYIFYGCHCGYGGRGIPKDDIDWCCHVHDCCYGRLSDMGCRPKFVPYNFTMENGNLTCGSSWKDDCERLTCECDREAAYCFKEHDETYSGKFMLYPQIRCRGPTPKC